MQTHLTPEISSRPKSESVSVPSPFRIEALRNTQGGADGTILIFGTGSHRGLNALLFIISLCLVFFLGFFSYSRKVQISGIIVPNIGIVKILPTQAGVIVERNAIEGQVVEKGQALFVISSERESVTQGNAEKAVSSLLKSRRDSLMTEREQIIKQASVHRDAAFQRARNFEDDVAKMDAQIDLQTRRVKLAQKFLFRSEELQAQHFVSMADVQDKQALMLDQEQRLGDLKRSRTSIVRDMTALRSEIQEQTIQVKRDLENALRNVASIEQDLTENEAHRQIVVRATQGGSIGTINVDIGQTVAINQPLATIIPSGAEFVAELYAPSRAVGFLKSGADVLIRYQAYPYQKFGQHHGQVREISNSAMRQEEMALPNAAVLQGATGETTYRVRVKLDKQTVKVYGNEEPLRSGMLIDASLLLEKRRLYEWALEPLYTITGRI